MGIQSIATYFLCFFLVWGLGGKEGVCLLKPANKVVQGTMKYVPIEGGCWVLEDDQGKKYEIVGNHPRLYSEGLRVVLLLKKPSQPVYGFCPGEKMVLVQVIRID